MASTDKQRRSTNWLSGLLGGRAIERRVDENFPTWQEYAEQKILEEHERAEEAARISLPPHRVYISSPLHGSFVYFVIVVVGLALGIYSPELGPVMVYVAIGVVLLISLAMVFRDALFFHIEGLRLEADAEMINRHTRGPQEDRDEQGMGFLRSFSRKHRNRKIFRSSLLQIHYQNVLRTFEQGNRRTWVGQDASIADLHTLLSQRGMKLVWTMIEVLPQLGLLGTLIGLIRMFTAFSADIASPEVALLAGFGTALGTTVVANILVLVLRPLYMRNERAMNEILSTIQSLMAMFILPTQQSVLERSLLTAFGASPLALPQVPQPTGGGGGGGVHETRLLNTLGELTHALGAFTEVQQQVDSGQMARETAEVAQEVKQTLRAFQDAVDRNQIERQQRAIEQLTEAVQGLAGNLREAGRGGSGGPDSQRLEQDLTQLRVLTHDTLLLLEQLSARLDPIPARKGKLLSTERGVRREVFDEGQESGLTELGEEEQPGVGGRGGQVRLFREQS